MEYKRNYGEHYRKHERHLHRNGDKQRLYCNSKPNGHHKQCHGEHHRIGTNYVLYRWFGSLSSERRRHLLVEYKRDNANN